MTSSATSRTLRAVPGDFAALVLARSERAPDVELYRFVDSQTQKVEQRLSAAHLSARARSVAVALNQAGASGKPVLILQQPGPEYVVSLFGAWFAAAIPVPVFPPRAGQRDARVASIALDCGARHALTLSATLRRQRASSERQPWQADLEWIATDALIDDGGALGGYRPPREVPTAALLQYTSGSTATPKGVVLRYEHFHNNVHAMGAAIARMRGRPIDARDHIVSWLPPYHDMGLLLGVLAPLLLELPATLLAPATFMQSPQSWLTTLSNCRGTISGGPNFGYELCVRRVPEEIRRTLDLSAWSVAISGAERIRASTLERFSAAFRDSGFRASAWAPSYGLAEATLGVSFRAAASGAPRVCALDLTALGQGVATPAQGDAPSADFVACGRAVANTEIVIVDPETCAPLREQRVGEIWVRGPGVAAGYFANETETRAAFQATLAGANGSSPRYLRTGDLGFLSDGELFVTGRRKDLLILGGLNRHPEDIEQAVEGCHPSLRAASAVAFAVEHEAEERLVVVQELARPRAEGADQAIAAIVECLAGALQLAAHDVVLVPPGEVPRTSSGKLQRRLCKARYEAGELAVLARLPRVEPVDETLVLRVCALMSEVLSGAAVQPDDDFFALGAHSLLATQLLSRLTEGLGVELGLRDLFSARTPRALAARVAEAPRRAALPPMVHVDRAGALPLSFSQERMWFLHQLDPHSAAYNVAGAVTARGALDVVAFERALAQLVARHELMRSTYPTLDGQPRVQIAEHLRLHVPYVDVSSADDPLAAAQRKACEFAGRPFDLAHDALIRVQLLRLAPDLHVIALSMHHMISDAWSVGVLTRELSRAYVEQQDRVAPPAPRSAFGYVDYAAWQRSALTRQALQHELAFWQRTLAGVEPLSLPTDHPRPRQRSSRGAFEPLALTPGLLDSVHDFARAEGATTFMVLLAAFAAVLQRHTRSSDFVVGVPVANRNRLASEPLIGTLVNTLAIRLRPRPEQPFRDLVHEVREACLDAYAHQDLPFERLVSELGAERRAGESPLVQVMFDYQNAPTEGRRMGDLTLTPLMISRGAAQFDLSLLVFDAELGQLAGVEYATDLFEAATIQRLLGHYLRLLASGMAEPSTALARLDMLSAGELSRLFALASQHFELPRVETSVQARIAHWAMTTPDAVAVSDDHKALSYRELLAASQQVAERLLAHGVAPGARVAICLDRSTDLVVALLGVLRAGAAYVPLDPSHPSARIESVLEDAAPECVLVHERHVSRIAWPAHVALLSLERRDVPAEGTHVLPEADLSAPAYVLYTSGSTGKPKGVAVSGLALANFLRSMAHTPGISPRDTLLSVTTVTFDIAGLEIFLPLSEGASVHLASSEVIADGPRLRALFEQLGPSLLQATPAMYRLLIEAGWQGSSSVRLLCGGEALSRELADALLARCSELWNVYGPTETTIWSTLHRVTPGVEPVPIGEPIDRTRVYVLDEQRQLAPLGVPGELYIGGDGVALGYLGRPDLTAERFLPDPFADEPGARMYRTGDLARFRGDGALECLGRLDAQIKLRGFRIEPAEIEAALKLGGFARDAVVIAREAKPGDLRLIAYYVPAGPALATQELREALARVLPAYMLPASFVALPLLPLTPSGKIDRKALPAPDDASAAEPTQVVEPRDAVERLIAEVWAEVLSIPSPGVRHDFFALGGHSLLAVRVLAALERKFQLRLPVQVLLENPTIEGLARAIRELCDASQGPASKRTSRRASERPNSWRPQATSFQHLVPLREGGRRAPLFCVHGAGGHVMNLTWLVRHLSEDRPFYGIQARGVDGISAPLTRIEHMAAVYLGELRKLCPRGPYYLSGYCGGGVVAFAMARMLLVQGEQVAFLGLIDTYRPGSVPTAPRFAWLKRDIDVARLAAHAKRGVARNVEAARRNTSIALRRAVRATVPLELRDVWLTNAFFEASTHFIARPYAGRLTLFRATDVRPALLAVPELGWHGLARAGIDVLDVPGDHDTVTSEANAPALAARFEEALRAAERSDR